MCCACGGGEYANAFPPFDPMSFLPTWSAASLITQDVFAPMIVTSLETILRTTLGKLASDTGRPFQALHLDWFFNVFWIWYWYYLGFVFSYDTWIDWISWVLSAIVDTLDLVCELTDTCVTVPLIGEMTYLDIGAAIDIFDGLRLVTGNVPDPNLS